MANRLFALVVSVLLFGLAFKVYEQKMNIDALEIELHYCKTEAARTDECASELANCQNSVWNALNGQD